MGVGMLATVVVLAMVLVGGQLPQAYCQRVLVGMTVVRNASANGAYCLDGSLPAYHWHRGFGSGENNWLLQFEGGGWCNDVETCLDRAKSSRGSTRYMSKYEVFSGILSNDPSLNPDFYNWNRVKLRYCDGASFTGDGQFNNGTSSLYFRGQRIWHAIILDLLPKGLGNARKALLSGCSAGGLSVFLHCDSFTKYLPASASVKCLSDAGFFLDVQDISSVYTMRSFYKSLILLQVACFLACYKFTQAIPRTRISRTSYLPLQDIQKNLNINCTSSVNYPALCFFPQYALKFITTPIFILNSAYDVFQFHHILVPPSSDPRGHWSRCKLNSTACNATQIQILQGFRSHMIEALKFLAEHTGTGGMFINSCFTHCQSESQDTWFAPNSPRIHNRTIAEAVGEWYFGRRISKEIDCPYPCDSTCHNLIPAASGSEEYT